MQAESWTLADFSLLIGHVRSKWQMARTLFSFLSLNEAFTIAGRSPDRVFQRRDSIRHVSRFCTTRFLPQCLQALEWS